MRSKLLNAFLLIIAFLTACAAVAAGDYIRSGLQVQPGDIWNGRKIKATADVENHVATERNRVEAEERAANREPIRTHDPSVWLRAEDNLNAFFIKLDAIRDAYAVEAEERRAAEEERLRLEEEARRQREELEAERAALAALESAENGETEGAPETGPGEAPPDDTMPDGTEPDITDPDGPGETTPGDTEPDITEPPFEAYGMFSSLPVIFTEAQQHYLLEMPEERYTMLTATVYAVTDSTLEQGVRELDNKVLLSVSEEFKRLAFDADAVNIGYEIVITYLSPNVVVNEEATLLERETIANDYEHVFLQKDQTILDDGDVVTVEAYALIQELGMLNTGLADKLVQLVGIFFVITAMFTACAMYLRTFNKRPETNKKESIILFTLFMLVLGVTWAVGDSGYTFLPLLVFAMLVSILINPRASLLLSLGMTVLCYFVVNGSLDYLLFYLTAGTLMCLLARYTTERNKVFMVGLLTALVNFVLSCAISLIIEKNDALAQWQSIVSTGGVAALNGLLTVIICTGSLPLWEALFGVVTPIKLLDLTNPTNMLLRRLTIEAPGTYHHSLIVANLAETAAYDIGANPSTARAGGYYHDIGKLKYPQYFVENLAGENPHDSMDPFNSVQLIVSHVAYGLQLATEYHLPQFLRDIIREHHGTSLIYFFYVKAKEENPDTPINENDFRYPFTIPQTRESACVMLADTVEAAIRAMLPKVKSIDEMECQIHSLIKGKLNDGQLADSGLSIKDVDVIAASFYRVLKGMYHERITYPKPEHDEDESLMRR